MMALRGGDFRRYLGHEGGSLMSGVSVFIKEILRIFLGTHIIRGYTERSQAMCHEEDLHQNVTTSVTFSQTSQLPDCEQLNSVVYRLLSLWYFVIAAQMNQDIICVFSKGTLEEIYKYFLHFRDYHDYDCSMTTMIINNQP